MSDMPHTLAEQLRALEPSVDMEASRKVFDRGRSQHEPSRRWFLPAAVLSMLVAGVVGIWALAGDDDGTVPADAVDPADPTGEEFELLALSPTTRTAGTIETATDAEQLAAALAPLTDEAIDVEIDHDKTLAVLFNVPGNSCPWKLDRFEVDGDIWIPQFSETGGDCNDVGLTWAYVVGIDRSVLGDSVTFRIPNEFGGGSTVSVTFGGDTGASYAVLLVGETSAPVDSISTATDPDELASAIALIADVPRDLAVDLERSVVAVFNRFGNACPLDLIGFDISGEANDVWSQRFRSSGEACDDVGVTWAYVVAFDRSIFGPSVTFEMPDDAAAAGEQIDPIDEPEPGEEFELIAVEATALPFGTIRVAQSDDEFTEWWAEDLPGVGRPDVDFDQSFVAAFTLPDDACPDVLVQFVSDTPPFVGAPPDGVVWIPEFEPPPGGCRLPLITRTYVVRIDRPAVGTRITFRLPADDVYDYRANEVTVDVESRTTTIEFGTPDETEPAAAEAVLMTELPAIGTADSVMSLFGPIWIVHHEDGTVSALPAVVEMPADEDTGVSGLGRLVAWDDSSRTFAGRWVHDEYGRTVNGPRSDDLVGFDTFVDGETVEVVRSDRDRIPGDPLDVPLAGDHALRPLDLGETLDLDVLPTASFRDPIWRMLDASLVVEDGTGRLCVVDGKVPVPELLTCEGDGVETALTSSQPDITSWFFGPVLAEFDEFGEITTVVPLGGQAARNDGVDRPSTPSSSDGWRTLLRTTAGDFPAMPVVVADDGAYATLATDLRASSTGVAALPPVDFDESLVVAFGLGAGACLGPLISMLGPETDQIRPVFAPADVEECTAQGLRYTFVVSVDRSTLGDLVHVVVPKSVEDFTGQAIEEDRTATFRASDGVLIADGLEIAFPLLACEDDQQTMQLTVTTSGPRRVALSITALDNILATTEINLPTGTTQTAVPIDLSTEVAIGLQVAATSDDPPGTSSIERAYDQETLAGFLAECT